MYLPMAIPRANKPPVLVPDIQSKQSFIGIPAASSIAINICISKSPRIPPPSKHRT